jgi:hypothetical protein
MADRRCSHVRRLWRLYVYYCLLWLHFCAPLGSRAPWRFLSQKIVSALNGSTLFPALLQHGTCCLYLGHSLLMIVYLGVRVWTMELGYGTNTEGDKQPIPQSAGKPRKRPSKSAYAAFPSALLRTSVRPHFRSVIFLALRDPHLFFPYSSLPPLPHLART